MKEVYGEYFACGYAFSSDSHGVVLDGVAIDKFQEWIHVETKLKVLGIYPNNIQNSAQNAGKTFQLDIFKIVANDKDIYFGCYEWSMCWYLFYKFTDNELARIKQSSKAN